MDYLPDEESRRWTLDALAEIARYAGPRFFLEAPLLEPTPAFFPDRWTADRAGVRRILRRLMSYAGMKRFGIELETFTNDEIPAFDSSGRVFARHNIGEAAAWFAGIDGSVCHFGVDTRQLEDPASLVATLCHEVAHAFRSARGLEYESRDEDEPRTDLTTIYLGFGILTVNAAYRFRSDPHKYSHATGGYVDARTMSFALAAQCVARRMNADARKSVTRHLETNQVTFFRAAAKHLETSSDLPERLRAGKAPRPAGVPSSKRNAGLPVFRIRGGWLRAARCSEPDCSARLPKAANNCPGCGGQIAGEIDTPEQHAAAESRLLAKASDSILSSLKAPSDGEKPSS